jgi:PTH1 family peptidyl-tRNA hydrolase
VRRPASWPVPLGPCQDLLVLGLGNPGREFEGTRHNVGARTVRELAARRGVRLAPERGTRAEVAWVPLHPADPGGTTGRLVLAVPQTYMNDSGLAGAALVRRYRLSDPARLVVVHDELDLEPGQVRVKLGGGTAGHNGLRSLHAHLHDPGYVRVRIGVGKPPDPRAGADYVLARPSGREAETLAVACVVAADAVELIAEQGVAAAMTAVNGAARAQR